MVEVQAFLSEGRDGPQPLDVGPLEHAVDAHRGEADRVARRAQARLRSIIPVPEPPGPAGAGSPLPRSSARPCPYAGARTLSATASAARMPSIPAERMPPAWPAPSPDG